MAGFGAANLMGSTAGGFLQGFLAVQNLRMRREWYQYLMNRKAGDTPQSAAAKAYQAGKDRYTAGSGDGSAAASTKAGMISPDAMATGKLVHDELTKRGVDPSVGAGAVGSLMGESGTGLDPKSRAKGDGADGSDSVGLANWNQDRAQNLYKFAGTNDISKISPATQAKFIGWELDNTPQGQSTLGALKQAKPGDVGAGTTIWTKQYEVPKDADAAATARMPYGQQFNTQLQNPQVAEAPLVGQNPVTGEKLEPAAMVAPTAAAAAQDDAAGKANIAAREAQTYPGGNGVRTDAQGNALDPSTGTPTFNPPANPPTPPVRPADPQSTPTSPPQQAIPLPAIPQDQASNDPNSMAARRGGVVRRYALGGPVKRYDLGGGVDDGDNDVYQSQRELAMTDDAGQGQQTAFPLISPAPDAASGGGVDPANQEASNLSMHMPHVAQPRLPQGGAMPRATGAGGAGGDTQYATPYPDVGAGNSAGAHADLTPQIADEDGNLSDGASGAIKGALSYLASSLKGSNPNMGAMPVTPSERASHQGFINGDAAPSKQEMDAVQKKVNPDGTLDQSMANIAGLEAVHKFYLANGQPEMADKAAASMLMYSREAAAQFGDEAITRFYKGDTAGGLAALVKGYDQVPDGHTVKVEQGKDGNATVTQSNMQGKKIWQETVGPQQILGAAIGLKDGTMYWKLLSEAAGKNDPDRPQGAQDPGMAAALERMNGRAPQAAPGAPAPSAPQAIPTAPSGNGASPPVQAGGATPPAPVQTAAQTPPQPQQTAIQPPVNPDAPAPGAVDASAQGAPTLPDQTVAFQREQEQLHQQYFANVPQRPTFDAQYYAKLSPGDQKIYAGSYKQSEDAWKQAAGDAQKQYNEAVGTVRASALADTNQARDRARESAAAVAADKRAQLAAEAADKRQQQAATMQTDRQTAAATLQDQRAKEAQQRDVASKILDRAPTPQDTDLAQTSLFGDPAKPDPTSTKFAAQFSPSEKLVLRDATAKAAAWSQVPADAAAASIQRIITPKGDVNNPDPPTWGVKDIPGSDTHVQITFKSKSGKGAATDVEPIVMTKEHLEALQGIRQALIERGQMADQNANEQSRRNSVLNAAQQVHDAKTAIKIGQPAYQAPPRGYVPVIDRSPGPRRQAIPTQ